MNRRVLAEFQPSIPIIDRLTEIFVPVEPAPEFRDALKAKLVAAWYEQRREQNAKDRLRSRFSLSGFRSRQQRGRFILRAAVVGSFVSVAALITVARLRMHHVRAH